MGREARARQSAERASAHGYQKPRQATLSALRAARPAPSMAAVLAAAFGLPASQRAGRPTPRHLDARKRTR